MRTTNLGFLLAMAATGCVVSPEGAQDEMEPEAALAAESFGDNLDIPAIVLPKWVPIAGKSQQRWTQEYWRWLLAQPASQNPELVLDQDCGTNQSGPVFFIPGFAADVYTRHCDVPFGKLVLVPIWSYLNDYPCPDPNFQPPPGETLQEFLTEGAQAFNEQVTELEARVDGHLVKYTKHRLTTPLFEFTGSATLSTTFDACITGTPQHGVSDGWWAMIAPPAPGQHTIEITAIAPSGNATSQTFELTVAFPD